MTTPDPSAQPSVFQIYGPKELVLGSLSFSIGELSARCTRIPELAPILKSLEELRSLVEHVSWNFRSRCRKLISQAVVVLCKVCYYHENGSADRLNPAIIVEITTVITEVKVNFRVFKEWSVWRALRMRRDAIGRLSKHKESLKDCLENFSVAAAPHSQDNAADAQRALNHNQTMTLEDERIPPSELAYCPSPGLAGDSSPVRADSEVGVTPNDISPTASSEALQHPQVNGLPSSEGDCEKWTRFITVGPGKFGWFKIKSTSFPIYGGFSDVWQGDAKLSDGSIIPVAIKKFRAVRIAAGADENAITDKLLKRLTNELGNWMAVQHPNIAPVIGFFLSEGLGIISPWYSNGNVAAYLGRDPEVDRVKLVSDVAQGLAYLHSLDPLVVHGDLKPDNVLITGTGSAVIIDFGLSLIMEHGTKSAIPAPSTAASTSLQGAGNVRWMAPELLMEDSCIRSPSTDVYSFGSVTLYIYTGKLPFTRIANDWQIPIALDKGQNPVAHREEYTALFMPGIEWLCKLLLSCWDIKPERRPSMAVVQETVRSLGMKASSSAALPRRNNC